MEPFFQTFLLLLIEINIFKKKVEAWIEKLMGCDLLPEADIITLCKKAKEVFNQVAIINMMVKLTSSSFVKNLFAGPL